MGADWKGTFAPVKREPATGSLHRFSGKRIATKPAAALSSPPHDTVHRQVLREAATCARKLAVGRRDGHARSKGARLRTDIDSPKKGYKFFRERARDGKPFTLKELQDASGWSRSSIDTYKSKQWKDLLEKVAPSSWTVRKEFLRLSENEFLDHISQKRPLFSRYSRKGHQHYVMFEFLLPLTRESQLRAALDDLFYAETVQQRLREIGPSKLTRVVERKPKESVDDFYSRIATLATDRFGGYSVSQVSGRYKAASTMTRQAAVEYVAEGGRYLIDETTAVVRFIVPCQAESFTFSDTLEPSPNWLELFDAPNSTLDDEVHLIRRLFFLLFVETVVRTVKGEDEIWLVESGVNHRLYRWERVAS